MKSINRISNRYFLNHLLETHGKTAAKEQETDIPAFSSISIKIFNNLTETSTSLHYPLSTRFKTLKNTTVELQNAKDHATRNKIVGILKGALHVSIIALGILAAATLQPEVGIPIAICAFLTALAVGAGYLYLDHANTSQDEDEDNDGLGDLFIAHFFGWALTIYNAFTQVGRLEAKEDKLSKEIACHYFNLKCYFEKNKESLRRKLQENINSTKDQMESQKNPSKKTELEQKLKEDETALAELEKGITFFTEQET